MRNLILSLLVCGSILELFSQSKPASPAGRGASPIITPNSLNLTNSTYAIVVGISDYQDPQIPDLRFADKDAEAFANYLRSSTGGKLDIDHLKVLLNEKATMAQFAIALDWLMEVVKENDQVIIYFSGHGDVEKKTITQPGYLLCWDAPSRVYLAGGALALPMFQDIITTLSTQNKAKVMVITDACHSGKLAGSSVGGSQITGANLAKQYANEIKILSCQPNEYSIEGEQWGGGRGAFSYHLIDALYGMADNNNDLIVNLQEAGRYIEDHVSSEVSPISQVPMVLGNRTDPLSNVDSKMLASLKSGKSNQMSFLSAIDSRGMEEDVLANVDTSVLLIYKLFKQALKDKVFLEPMNACVETYYAQLIIEPKLKRLHSTLRRNYAAALQDDVQQVINKLMTMENTEILLYRLERLKKYSSYPRLLERAADLLGSNHYIYPTLKARKSFFEGWLLQLESPLNPDSILANRILEKYRHSVTLQPDFALAYFQMSSVFNRLSPNLDSLLFYHYKYIELAPTWTWAINQTSTLLIKSKIKFDVAKKLLDQSLLINSTNADTWTKVGMFHYHWFETNRDYRHLDSMEACLQKALGIDSLNYDTWNWLGILHFNGRNDESGSLPFFQKAIEMHNPSANVYMYIGAVHANAGNLKEAESFYKKGLSIEPYHDLCLIYLARIYMKTHRGEEGKVLLQKAMAYDSTTTRVQSNLGYTFYNNAYYPEAEIAFKRTIALDSYNIGGWLGLGDVYWKTKQYAELEQVYLKATTINPKNAVLFRYLGDFYLFTNRDDEAKFAYKKALHLNSKAYNSLMGLATVYARIQDIPLSFKYLRQSLEAGFSDFKSLDKKPEFASLRAKPEWMALMKKYFPEKIKN
ncbi:MAG: caspase family protein [Saprospiraceae bacterium]